MVEIVRVTVRTVVDPGQTALITALVTATVSSSLASLLTLSFHHQTHITILSAVKPQKVAKSSRPLFGPSFM